VVLADVLNVCLSTLQEAMHFESSHVPGHVCTRVKCMRMQNFNSSRDSIPTGGLLSLRPGEATACHLLCTVARRLPARRLEPPRRCLLLQARSLCL
jgi:hypothetical protein